MKNKRIKIGVVGVDSGQLVICDPCYINHKGEQKELNNYEEILKRGTAYAQLNYDLGHKGLGVVFNSGFGDGTYDVYATIEKVGCWGKRVKKVEVILIEEEGMKNENIKI